MTVETFLSRLDRVRRTGPGRWTARCPSHEDRSPSLSVRELDDGRILLHDFGGCSVEEVLGALGLDFDALFPEKPIEGARRERRPFNPGDVLDALAFEATIVAIAAGDMAQGKPMTDVDRVRLMLAAERLHSAEALCRGR